MNYIDKIKKDGIVYKIKGEGGGSGGGDLPEFVSNKQSFQDLKTTLEAIALDEAIENPEIDRTFVFDCADGQLWRELWGSLDTEAIRKIMGAFGNFEGSPTLMIKLDIGSNYLIQSSENSIGYSATFYDTLCIVETDAETGDSTVVAGEFVPVFSGTVRVIYNPEGIIKE